MLCPSRFVFSWLFIMHYVRYRVHAYTFMECYARNNMRAIGDQNKHDGRYTCCFDTDIPKKTTHLIILRINNHPLRLCARCNDWYAKRRQKIRGSKMYCTQWYSLHIRPAGADRLGTSASQPTYKQQSPICHQAIWHLQRCLASTAQLTNARSMHSARG